MSNSKRNYSSKDELEEGNSLIKESSGLNVKTLYQILIKNPYLVNAIDNKKETILSYSLKNGNIEVSNLILTSPILDLDFQDKDGNTYLHLAVIAQQEDIIKSLIEKGIFINKQNKDGNTGLHLAYILNDNSIINLLLESGIDKNIVNKDNKLAEEMKIKPKKYNQSLNNEIRGSKLTNNSRDGNKRKDNKNYIEKNIRKKNNTSNNTNVNTMKKCNNVNRNYNNSKSTKLGIETKVKTPYRGYRKNDKITNLNSNNNDDTEENFNDIISIEDDYKARNNNYNFSNKKYTDFEKTIKIDWSVTNKNNINSNRNFGKGKNIKDNYNDQDICNIDDNSSFYNKEYNNTSEKISHTSEFFSNKNNSNNKLSPKIKNNNKAKNTRNNNKNNNCLRSSTGYNNCNSREYIIKSDNRHSKNVPSNIIINNLDISSSHNVEEVNQYNESKMNTINNNDNFIDFEDVHNSYPLKMNNDNDNDNYFNQKDNFNSFHAFSGNFEPKQVIKKEKNEKIIKNIPKRKTATSNTIKRNILSPNVNKKIKDENNLNIKSSNMASSFVTQSRIKISNKKNNPLIEFLSQINLLKYLNDLDNNGFDDINLLIDEAKKGNIIKDQELKECGINIPGDRAKILIRIKEKANMFGFALPKSIYYVCQNMDDIENDQHIKNLNKWLSDIKVERYLINFVENGYHSIELLLMQMETENPLTTEILRDEIGIDKIGYRSRILNKLKEEGRSLNNKLKTSALIVNNRGDDKNCECSIF